MKKLICVILILISTLFFIQPVLLAREIAIDDTLKVELIDNKMSSEDAQRVFNYVKSAFYDRGAYTSAEEGFQKIVDYAGCNAGNGAPNLFERIKQRLRGERDSYDKFGLRDDALYYIGKCKYHRGHRMSNGREEDLFVFEQVYYLYPKGSVVKSGQLRDTLLNILDKTDSPSFSRMLRVYNLLATIHPESIKTAQQIIRKKTNEKHTVRWRFKEYVPVKIYEVIDNKVQYDGKRLRKYLEKRMIYSFESYEKLADYVWRYFLHSKLSHVQLKKITPLVKKNTYLDFKSYRTLNLIRADAAPFSEDCIECDVAVEISFHELLEASGVSLFGTGSQKEGDI